MRQDDINENVLNKLGVTCTFELTCLALFSSRVDLISSRDTSSVFDFRLDPHYRDQVSGDNFEEGFLKCCGRGEGVNVFTFLPCPKIDAFIVWRTRCLFFLRMET